MTRLTAGHGVSTVAGRLATTARTELAAGIAAFSGLLGLSLARRRAGPRLTVRRWRCPEETADERARPGGPVTHDQRSTTPPQPARPVPRRYETDSTPRSGESTSDGDPPDQGRRDSLPPLLRGRSAVRRAVRRLSGGGLRTISDTLGPQVLPLGTDVRLSGVTRRLSSDGSAPGLVVVLPGEEDSEGPPDGRRSSLRSVRRAAVASRPADRSTPTMIYPDGTTDNGPERPGTVRPEQPRKDWPEEPRTTGLAMGGRGSETGPAPTRSDPAPAAAGADSRRPPTGRTQSPDRSRRDETGPGQHNTDAERRHDDPPPADERSGGDPLGPPTADFRASRHPTADSQSPDRQAPERRETLSADTDRSFSRLYRRFRRRLETERRRRGL